MKKGWALILDSFRRHPLLHGLALTPVIMASSTLQNGAAMSLAFFLMTFIPVAILSFCGKKFAYGLHAPIYVLLSAAVYPFARWCLNGIFGQSIASLGIYLPLLMVNGVLMQFAFEKEHPCWYVQWVRCAFASMEFSAMICVLSLVREWLVFGTVWGYIVPVHIHAKSVSMPFFAMILLAVFIGFYRFIRLTTQKMKEKSARKVGEQP